ncbi:ABC transporter substrate-binding protein [Amycolatopsis jiangsuensis]|uniref:NitT/TauT family transport system substrate-binding protein n=1 Tax=Amycolatopsis jiangsuensis TaxID=1181879 RepID=A0A840IXP5_9PSEU|nr:ABC transporter substrate-binding protein [Amycolatopsis jiangsuensis]MBB4685654.1 NitT/TauT family transport system substrate-binding protein [Amycolatopsis jiangsuensis]
MRTFPRSRLLVSALAALTVVGAVAGCSRADRAETATDQGAAGEVRVGFFPNVTHTPALLGVKKNFFAQNLGSTKLTTQTFNAGPAEVNALLGESLDVAFLGSGPAINGFTQSKGAIQLVSGAVSGGAQLVVKPDITSVEGLKGKNIATPQLANTQDVALKKFLAEHHLTGQVQVTNTDNPKTLDAFRKGEVDGGWLPEPWSSRLVNDAGAKVLVDEKSLWPQGRFPTTVVVVRSQFLKEHPDTVRALLKGELQAIDWAKQNPAEAKSVVNNALKELSGSTLSPAVLDRAFTNIELTTDPVGAQFPQLAKDSVTAGVVDEAPDLKGFADFGPLNEVLKAQNLPAVSAPGLAK